MVRQRPRKSVEEVYGSKFDSTNLKTQLTTNSPAKKTRNDCKEHSDLSGYIITSNTAYNNATNINNGNTTNRRKTARPAVGQKTEKLFKVPEEKMLDESKPKEHTIKAKTTRTEKCTYNTTASLYENKNFMEYTKSVSQKDLPQNVHHHHHAHHTARECDDDKDDDTEEFFELIRHTVDNAIGKSISEVLNRNFRDLSMKIDRFSNELKETRAQLNKLQSEINNKVVHYGEENSRHFRYLCMKSEYDKMFYQHHTMLASTQPSVPEATATTSAPPTKRQSAHKLQSSVSHGDLSPCTCRSNKAGHNNNPEVHKTSSEDHSMSIKSSELGMREVLEHIQRFCNQMQLNDLKGDERGSKQNYRLDEALKINKQVFEEDDDDFQISSDGMTPRSDDILNKYVSTSIRSGNNSRGGGDA